MGFLAPFEFSDLVDSSDLSDGHGASTERFEWLKPALPSWPAGRAKSTSLNFEVPACSSRGLDSMQPIGAWLSQDSPGL